MLNSGDFKLCVVILFSFRCYMTNSNDAINTLVGKHPETINILTDFFKDRTIKYASSMSNKENVAVNSTEILIVDADITKFNFVNDSDRGKVIVIKGKKVTTNNKTIDYNFGTVVTNSGTVTTNEGTVTTNDFYGTVTTNETGGTVSTNEKGTVTTNKGTVTTNKGTVATNGTDGTVITNKGTVTINKAHTWTNETDGTVIKNEGIITTNKGTVATNETDGSITTNGMITVDNGMITAVGELNNGTVTVNNGTIKINYGTVATNETGGKITTNYRPITTNRGTITKDSTIIGTIGFENQMVDLGWVKGTNWEKVVGKEGTYNILPDLSGSVNRSDANGDQKVGDPVLIPPKKTLFILKGITLNVSKGATLLNWGTIENYGTITAIGAPTSDGKDTYGGEIQNGGLFFDTKWNSKKTNSSILYPNDPDVPPSVTVLTGNGIVNNHGTISNPYARWILTYTAQSSTLDTASTAWFIDGTVYTVGDYTPHPDLDRSAWTMRGTIYNNNGGHITGFCPPSNRIINNKGGEMNVSMDLPGTSTVTLAISPPKGHWVSRANGHDNFIYSVIYNLGVFTSKGGPIFEFVNHKGAIFNNTGITTFVSPDPFDGARASTTVGHWPEEGDFVNSMTRAVNNLVYASWGFQNGLPTNTGRSFAYNEDHYETMSRVETYNSHYSGDRGGGTVNNYNKLYVLGKMTNNFEGVINNHQNGTIIQYMVYAPPESHPRSDPAMDNKQANYIRSSIYNDLGGIIKNYNGGKFTLSVVNYHTWGGDMNGMEVDTKVFNTTDKKTYPAGGGLTTHHLENRCFLFNRGTLTNDGSMSDWKVVVYNDPELDVSKVTNVSVTEMKNVYTTPPTYDPNTYDAVYDSSVLLDWKTPREVGAVSGVWYCNRHGRDHRQVFRSV